MLTAKHDVATIECNLKQEIEAVLTWQDEDARAAIATLLADIRHPAINWH